MGQYDVRSKGRSRGGLFHPPLAAWTEVVEKGAGGPTAWTAPTGRERGRAYFLAGSSRRLKRAARQFDGQQGERQ